MNGRQYDPRPVTHVTIDEYGNFQPGETLAEYIDRTILRWPTSRLRHVWGWPPQPRFFEPSYVRNPAGASQVINMLIQSGGKD